MLQKGNLQDIKLIVGLGNPGRVFRQTYHSVGFLALDYLAKNHPISNPSTSSGLALSKVEWANSKFRISKQFKYIKLNTVILIKPTTYMNKSGLAVAEALKRFNAKPKELLIIHDDSDVELGKYKLSFERGAAGHKGVESIIRYLGTKGFWRARIGIRKAGKPGRAETFVLKRLPKREGRLLENIFQDITRRLT